MDFMGGINLVIAVCGRKAAGEYLTMLMKSFRRPDLVHLYAREHIKSSGGGYNTERQFKDLLYYHGISVQRYQTASFRSCHPLMAGNYTDAAGKKVLGPEILKVCTPKIVSFNSGNYTDAEEEREGWEAGNYTDAEEGFSGGVGGGELHGLLRAEVGSTVLHGRHRCLDSP